MTLVRAGRPRAANAPKASGAALGGPHGVVYFPSGTKGQQPLVFPALDGLWGRASAPSKPRPRVGASIGVPRGTPHARIVTRMGRDAKGRLGRRH